MNDLPDGALLGMIVTSVACALGFCADRVAACIRERRLFVETCDDVSARVQERTARAAAESRRAVGFNVASR